MPAPDDELCIDPDGDDKFRDTADSGLIKDA